MEKLKMQKEKIHDPQNTKILRTCRVSINDFSFASNSHYYALGEHRFRQPMCLITAVLQ